MAKLKALITGRYSPEVETISKDAPSEVEICFLPRGEVLGDHVSDVDIIYGHIGETDLVKAKSLRWVQIASARHVRCACSLITCTAMSEGSR